METLRSRRMPAVVSSLAILLSIRGVTAHGDHTAMEKIQEGEYMSADPIVRCMTMLRGADADRRVGRDTMDSHLVDDAVLWHYIPNGNGTRCMYILGD